MIRLAADVAALAAKAGMGSPDRTVEVHDADHISVINPLTGARVEIRRATVGICPVPVTAPRILAANGTFLSPRKARRLLAR